MRFYRLDALSGGFRQATKAWKRALCRSVVTAAVFGLVAGCGPRVAEPPLVDTKGFDPEVARSIADARAAAEREPRSSQARGHLGMVLLAHDVRTSAAQCFAQASDLDAHEPRWPYFRALALLPENEAGAATNFDRAVRLFQSKATVPRLRLANALLGTGRTSEAEALYREVLSAGTDMAWAHLGLGKAALSRGLLQEAAEHLVQATEDASTRKAAHRMLLTVWQRLGRTNEAAHVASVLAELPTDNPLPDPWLSSVQDLKTGQEAWLDRADALLRAGQIQAAVLDLEKTIRTYPSSHRALFLLGRARSRLGDLPGAEEVLHRAIELAPDSVEAHVQLGVVQLARGHREAAQLSFRHAIQAKPNLPEAWFNLGLSLGNDHQEESVAAFREAIRLRPTFAEAYLALAVVFRAEGRNEAAVDELERALGLHPPEALREKLLQQLKAVQKR